MFHHFSIYWEWNVIIPTDFHELIFFRGVGVETTSKSCSSMTGWLILVKTVHRERMGEVRNLTQEPVAFRKILNGM